MKITDIRFGMLRVPLKTPFKTALRTVDTGGGHRGDRAHRHRPHRLWRGAGHGRHHRRHPRLDRVEAIGKFIRPAPDRPGRWPTSTASPDLIQTALERNTSAKAAVEIAVYDLWAQLYDAPLYKMLGGGDPVITTDITISVDYIDKMVADSISRRSIAVSSR